jgi:hypothetical protein
MTHPQPLSRGEFGLLPNYNNAGAEDMRRFALINILKDLAIMGFALHIAAGAHHQHIHVHEEDD